MFINFPILFPGDPLKRFENLSTDIKTIIKKGLIIKNTSSIFQPKLLRIIGSGMLVFINIYLFVSLISEMYSNIFNWVTKTINYRLILNCYFSMLLIYFKLFLLMISNTRNRMIGQTHKKNSTICFLTESFMNNSE